MALFTAHFDESGTPDETHVVLTVAGCVSSVKKWARFELEWSKILHDTRLPKGAIFHMNQFARNLPPYEDFKGHPERKAALISALVECTRRNVNKAFSCTVVLRDWERLNQRYCVTESFGYPYAFCGRTCVGQVLKWARNKRGASIQFFFEKGAKHQGQLYRILTANHDIEPNFRSKDNMVQFQAADLLAWKNRKSMADAVNYKDSGGGLTLYSQIMGSLAVIRTIPHDYGIHNYESMELLAQRANVPKR